MSTDTPITDAVTRKAYACYGSDRVVEILVARRLERDRAALMAALEKLAKLGNGDHYGNSDGNEIAKKALAAAHENFPPA